VKRSHFEMVDAVNDAKTPQERSRAEAELSGWREAADYFGHGWSGIDADLYTMEKREKPGEELSLCCGVLLNTGAAP